MEASKRPARFLSNQRLALLLSTHLRPVLLFLTVGAFSALINFSSFSFCWGLLKINYQASASIAYALSVIFHFTANRRFTFKSHHAEFGPQVAKYLTMAGLNYLITLMVMYCVVSLVGLSPYWGLVSAIAMTVGIGYLMSTLWVFRRARVPGG